MSEIVFSWFVTEEKKRMTLANWNSVFEKCDDNKHLPLHQYNQFDQYGQDASGKND